MQMPTHPSKKQKADPKNTIRIVGKYSGMAFQLFATCLAGALLGNWLDAKMQLERPLWAVFLTVFFMIAALYALYRQLLQDDRSSSKNH